MKVRAYRCPHDSREMPNGPVGQYHCPDCGCLQIAGMAHLPCYVGMMDASLHEGYAIMVIEVSPLMIHTPGLELVND